IPVWLNEGLAQWAEGMVSYNRGGAGGGDGRLDARQARIYRRYWSWKGLDSFWSGQSFHLAASQRASYQLADVMFQNLLSHPHRSRRLSEFLGTANHQDAGDAACRACFGCSLSSLAEEFLGLGSWQPPPLPQRNGT
ncbi:MAG: hypothetical protein FWD53_10915, partial [Phycisphaerales bacterium]|nr:hypothetical protein [Phycisphaerales bacterium]